MKFLLINLVALFVLLTSFAASETAISTSEEDINLSNVEKSYGDWYAVTGVTRNAYGQNYSISIRVQGSQVPGGCVSISQVQISSGGSWQKVNYNIVFGEECTYYVVTQSETYYFQI